METRSLTADSRAPLSSRKTSRQLACDALSLPKQAARVALSVCEEGATLTGESKEKAHSLLNTRSPVLGTLMVGMYGTSSSPRSAAIFAFLLLAPQCCGASGAAPVTGEDAIFKALRLYIPPTRGM